MDLANKAGAPLRIVPVVDENLAIVKEIAGEKGAICTLSCFHLFALTWCAQEISRVCMARYGTSTGSRIRTRKLVVRAECTCCTLRCFACLQCWLQIYKPHFCTIMANLISGERELPARQCPRSTPKLHISTRSIACAV
jgi:hypothetical protein